MRALYIEANGHTRREVMKNKPDLEDTDNDSIIISFCNHMKGDYL